VSTGPDRRPLIYRACQAAARVLWRLTGGSVQLEGIEHVPRTGPILIISNHQSLLDPILTQAFLPRAVYAMAKSTQFANPAMRWLMRNICSFPVRRYQVDAQATRHALRLLDAGEAVAIYIEAERSWNRQLQAPRPGTARIALRTSAPTILCAISGPYDAWPRWDRHPRPCTVRIRFRPIDLPTLRGPQNRRRARETANQIMNELAVDLTELQAETPIR